jgi:hypothetical protein
LPDRIDQTIVLRLLGAGPENGRILLTFDLDFADVRQYVPGAHAGIVVFRLQDRRWKTLEGPLNRLIKKGDLGDGTRCWQKNRGIYPIWESGPENLALRRDLSRREIPDGTEASQGRSAKPAGGAGWSERRLLAIQSVRRGQP